MKKQLTIGILFSLCLLSGCSKNNGNIDGSTSDHIIKEVIGANGQVVANIDADIIRPEVKDIPVANIKPYEFTNDDIKKTATTIYGDSDYYKLLTPTELSVSQLNDAIAEYELKITELEELYGDSDKISPVACSDRIFYYDTKIAELTEFLEDAPQEVDTSPELEFYDITSTVLNYYYYDINQWQNSSSESLEGCYLQGTYNNIPCSVKFCTNKSLYLNMDITDIPVWKNYTYKELSIEPVYNNYYTIDNTDKINDCKISVDQAIDMCNSLLTDLEISDMEIMVIYHLPVTAYETSPYGHKYRDSIESGLCGYEIYYGKSVNSVNSNMVTYDSPTNMYYGKSSDNLVFYPEELVFTVMDSGITSMHYYNPTVIDDISTSSTTLLDFGQILDLSDIYLPDIYGDKVSGAQPINITSIQLGLCRVVNDSDSSDISLIPVWNFYEKLSYNSVLTINAIDGSRINTYTGCVIE